MSAPRDLDTRAVGLVLLLSALWGGNTVAIKVGLADAPPLALGWMRFVLGGKIDRLPGALVQIPADTKHCLRNPGSETARLVIYVDRAKDVVTFDEGRPSATV